MTEVPYRAVDQLSGQIVDPITTAFVEAQKADAAASRLWENLANNLIRDVQTAKAGTAIAREKNAELETLVEGLGQRLRESEADAEGLRLQVRELEAAKPDPELDQTLAESHRLATERVRELESLLAVARDGRDTAKATNGGNR
jgi:hypothetical protein